MNGTFKSCEHDSAFVVRRHAISNIWGWTKVFTPNSAIFQFPFGWYLLSRINYLFHIGKIIHFCWLPSHIGIKGNEAADKAAKSALDKYKDFFVLPSSDFKSQTSQYIYTKWQVHWSTFIHDKLFEIKPVIGDSPGAGVKIRQKCD